MGMWKSSLNAIQADERQLLHTEGQGPTACIKQAGLQKRMNRVMSEEWLLQRNMWTSAIPVVPDYSQRASVFFPSSTLQSMFAD